MSAVATGSAWDEISGTASSTIVRRFESAWREAPSNRKPAPLDFAEDSSPALRLTLLRSDLSLRWESGERAEASRYRDLGLSEEEMVALAYEEFCLREEHGESPTAVRFYERYPDIARPLRRVLDIHDLVGSGHAASTTSLNPARPTVPFPEVGQTIAGFYLVEELGRGGFARVFLARERQLGDRPVALKVARAGSREPQTLARLQHTHIVPVHSYRTDPATGLHLLCMPYFGRVTLAHVLADKVVKDAIEGSELVAAIDRLDRESAAGSSSRTTGRRALTSRPYARAVAWWGARLAEALQHAHDRGVLHRDVKPSNVLVTADGMPMLLDFNLAHEPFDTEHEDAPSALGGTVAYMSPEHLDALADGRADGGDGRSDIYSLGVVLFEAMGARPFGPPPQARSVTEALRRTAESRRANVPRLRDAFPEAPEALEAVVARCLAADPSDRYARAADLAEDLQAVADDLPLCHAREPMLVRLSAKLRRHRRAMAATAIVLLALGVAGFYSFAARVAGDHLREQVILHISSGDKLMESGDYDQAQKDFLTAESMAEGSAALATLKRRASLRAKVADRAQKTTRKVNAFFGQAESIRLGLLGYGDVQARDRPRLDPAIAPFFVFGDEDWVERDEMHAIKAGRRAELANEVHQLLFLAILRTATSSDPARLDEAKQLCDKVEVVRERRLAAGSADADSLPEGPWHALRDYLADKGERKEPKPFSPPLITGRVRAWESFAWGQLLLLDGKSSVRAVEWLDKATKDAPGLFWLELDTAYHADQISLRVADPTTRTALRDVAFRHYNVAVDLDPSSIYARFNRGRLCRIRGAWGIAKDDLQRAIKPPDSPGLEPAPGNVELLMKAHVELGLVEQSLGDFESARREYDSVIKGSATADDRHAAMLNRARLDSDTGRLPDAIATIEELLRDDPNDTLARQARAMFALKTNDPARAELELDKLLAGGVKQADWLALRALARLALDRPDGAATDAQEAARLIPSPRHELLVQRTDLALGRFASLHFDNPDDVRALPSTPGLEADLRSAVNGMAKETHPAMRSTRAVILAALGDAAGAEADATRAIAEAPSSPRARLIRARLRRDRGNGLGAMADVAAGLAMEPDDPRLVALRAVLLIDSGEAAAALALLDRISHTGGGPAIERALAEARTQMGQGRAALGHWNVVVESDPDDAAAYLGRARAFLLTANWDAALADLERAAALSDGRGRLLIEIAKAYEQCLPHRPNRAARVADLKTRAEAAARHS